MICELLTRSTFLLLSSDHLLIRHDILHDQIFVFLSDGLVQFLFILTYQVLDVDVRELLALRHLILLHLGILRLSDRLLVDLLVSDSILFLILLLFQVSIVVLSRIDLIFVVDAWSNQLI